MDAQQHLRELKRLMPSTVFIEFLLLILVFTTYSTSKDINSIKYDVKSIRQDNQKAKSLYIKSR